MLTDKFHRVQDYLRISLTDSCNLRCGYCMPEDLSPCFLPAAEKMSAWEIGIIAKQFIDLGIKKIRLTGGEPLVRKDFSEILSLLTDASGNNVELAITTNGILVHRFLDDFKKYGIRSVNVSLDTLLPERFEAITRRNEFHRVLSNIHLLLQHNFQVKINMVVMKNINDDEITDFIRLTRDYPLEIRFIEFMPFRGNNWGKEKLVSSKEMLEQAKHYFEIELVAGNKNQTSRNYKVLGYEGQFGFISTMSEPFCEGCSRIRLTADGKMKNCLFSQEETDLLKMLRNGGDVKAEIQKSIAAKKEKWGGQLLFGQTVNRNMNAIGG